MAQENTDLYMWLESIPLASPVLDFWEVDKDLFEQHVNIEDENNEDKDMVSMVFRTVE